MIRFIFFIKPLFISFLNIPDQVYRHLEIDVDETRCDDRKIELFAFFFEPVCLHGQLTDLFVQLIQFPVGLFVFLVALPVKSAR